MVNKKAQIKVNQMAFMLIGVTIFFALVGMFALTLRVSSLRGSASELQEENAFLLASKIANSPEFSCGEAFGTKRADCIDLDKVMALKDEISKYEDFWGVNNLEIRIIYPKNKGIKCTSSNYPACDTIILIDKPVSGFDTSNYVSLCSKEMKGELIQDRCKLGKIFIRYEDKQ
jgi:hypothetical protein